MKSSAFLFHGVSISIKKASENVCITTYLSFSFKSTVYNLLKLLDFVTTDASKLISEFPVFIYERLDDIHLLI